MLTDNNAASSGLSSGMAPELRARYGESRGGADTRGVGAGGVADQRQPANRGLQVIIISEPSAEPARRARTDRSTPARNRSSTAHNDTPRHADARPISLHTEEIMSRPGADPVQIGCEPQYPTPSNVDQHHPTFPQATGRLIHQGPGRRSPRRATSASAARSPNKTCPRRADKVSGMAVHQHGRGWTG